MNRIVIIGNGFDLALGYKTSFKHFIDQYLTEQKENLLSIVRSGEVYRDDLYSIGNTWDQSNFREANLSRVASTLVSKARWKNDFLKNILIKYDDTFSNWSDFEYFYFSELKKQKREMDIQKLNKDFQQVCDLFLNYIERQVQENKFTNSQLNRLNDMYSIISDGAERANDAYHFLVFNYTPFAGRLFRHFANNRNENQIYYIHGRLNDSPIVGYGNNTDSTITQWKHENNNDRFRFMKQSQYPLNEQLSKFQDTALSAEFDVTVFGHSLGLSDATLLKTIFKHKKLHRVRLFYYKKSNGNDNFNDLSINYNKLTKNAKVLAKDKGSDCFSWS